jgi:hypothetical protein
MPPKEPWEARCLQHMRCQGGDSRDAGWPGQAPTVGTGGTRGSERGMTTCRSLQRAHSTSRPLRRNVVQDEHRTHFRKTPVTRRGTMPGPTLSRRCYPSPPWMEAVFRLLTLVSPDPARPRARRAMWYVHGPAGNNSSSLRATQIPRPRWRGWWRTQRSCAISRRRERPGSSGTRQRGVTGGRTSAMGLVLVAPWFPLSIQRSTARGLGGRQCKAVGSKG